MIDDMRPRPRPADTPRSTPQYQPRPLQPNPSFRTPDQVAAQDKQVAEERINMADEEMPPMGPGGQPPKKKRRSLKEWLKTRTKKQWVVIIIILVLALGGIGTGVYYLFFHKNTPVATTAKKPAKKTVVQPTTVASNLSGLQVKPEVNQRPVTAVMIENSVDARPQSGLDQASVVFEAVAEGGITRFVALFQDTAPDYIGPVRSVRPYYIQWAYAFDAAIAHVGGSPEALQNMIDWNVKDLNQFAYGSYFQRITSRAAPHNVYTSMSQLNEIESKRNYGTAKFTSLVRKKAAPSKTPTATSIDVNLSSSLYNSHYDYDAATNTYKRFEGGQPHMQVDQSGNQTQIAPKAVVLMTMPQSIASDGVHTAYGNIGSGHVYVFQDGIVTEGTWKKPSRQENITLTDGNGKAIGLNPGQTWFAAVGDTTYVTYK